MKRIIIAGGGIGGLATALACARKEISVLVLERRTSFAELGAGIQLGPNAFHALDRLGVGEQVRDRACHVKQLTLMDGIDGTRLAHLNLGERYQRDLGNPYAVVHRADLYAPLLRACREDPHVELRTDSNCAGYEQEANTVRVHLSNRQSLTGDLLIGADGIRSAVREAMLTDGPPKVSGHTIFRAVVPVGEVPESMRWNTVTLWAGPRWHFVHYLIAGGAYLNLAATIDDGALLALTGEPVERNKVLEYFTELHPKARQFLELGQEWKRWVLCDRDPGKKWTDGRVALLGDAAHPMLQYAAQGACMALEDAVVVADHLEHWGPTPTAFARYEADRIHRTSTVQSLARELGRQIYHAEGPARITRNRLLKSMQQGQLRDAMRWLHASTSFTTVPRSTIPDLAAA